MEYRTVFADRDSWAEMARSRGFQLPFSTKRLSARRLGAYALKLGVTPSDCGVKTWADLIRLNPDWPLFAHVGILLEMAQ